MDEMRWSAWRRWSPGRMALLATTSIAATAPLAAQPAKWQLSARPTVVIDDERDTLRTFVRIASLRRLEDGRIGVTAAFERHLRLFSADGKSGRAVGRAGSGPGDFQSVSWFGASGDTLLVFDGTLRRLSRFSPDGELLGTIPFDLPGQGVVGRFPDGSWLVSGARAVRSGMTNGVRRDTMELSRLPASGRGALQRLALAPGTASVPSTSGEGGATPTMMARQKFGPELFIAAHRDEVFIGDNATNVLRVIDRAGRERRRIVLPVSATALTPALIDALRRRELADRRSPQAKAMNDRWFAAELLPTHAPHYSRMFVSASGEVWIERHTPERERSGRYIILSAAGKRLATLDAPAGFRIHDAGTDWVLGVSTAPGGAESVRAYRLGR